MRTDIHFDLYDDLDSLPVLEKRLKSAPLRGISPDSRLIRENDIFLAIRGDTFDGHDFIPEAVSRGAKLIICSESGRLPGIRDDISYLFVDDTVNAVQHLARLFMKRFRKARRAIITGSVGKTTVKEMTGSILSSSGISSFITPKNYNSQIGVPLSILSMEDDPEIMIFEVGMSFKGEISRLSRIIEPDTALVLNIKDVHREFFSSLSEIRDAKLEFIEYMDPEGLIIFFNDDRILYEGIMEKWKGKTIRYSLNDKYSLKPARYAVDSMGLHEFSMLLPSGLPVIDVRLKLPGEHNLINAVSAACLCDCLQISPFDIYKGLSSFSGTDMRSRLYKSNGYIIYEDCYNSSPYALKCTLDAFSKVMGGKKQMVILGDMLELGEESRRYHLESVRYAFGKRIETVITIGSEFYSIKSRVRNENLYSFLRKEDSIDTIISKLKDHDKILIKGSRGIQLEKILQVINNYIFNNSK